MSAPNRRERSQDRVKTTGPLGWLAEMSAAAGQGGGQDETQGTTKALAAQGQPWGGVTGIWGGGVLETADNAWSLSHLRQLPFLQCHSLSTQTR